MKIEKFLYKDEDGYLFFIPLRFLVGEIECDDEEGDEVIADEK